MKTSAPPWLDAHGDVSDTETYARMTPEERLACFIEVCRLSDAVMAGRPDRERVLAEKEPLAPEDEKLWLRLVRESRLAGPGW